MNEKRTRLSRPMGALFVLVVLGYGCWAAFSGHGFFTHERVGYGADSIRYLRAAREPFWSLRFLAGKYVGPFGFLILAKLCARNLRAIVVVQSVISAAAWLFLASTVARLLHDARIRTVGFAVILLVALSPPALLWNADIITESLALSLLAVAVALWLRRDYGLLTAALVALACTRDTNAYLLLFIATLAAVAALRADRQRMLAIGATCLLAAIVTIGLADHARRWFYPLNDTIAMRVLHSSESRDYFVAHGMPDTPAIDALRDRYVDVVDSIDQDPIYASYER